MSQQEELEFLRAELETAKHDWADLYKKYVQVLKQIATVRKMLGDI